MSEKIAPTKTEALPSVEHGEKNKHNLEKLQQKAEKDGEKHSSAEHLAEVKKAVESQAISGKEMTPSEGNKDAKASGSGYINKELKDMAYRRSLNSARRHMSAPDRAFSKVIHAAPVEKASEALGNTVARPSGMLGGGLVAFIGSAVLLWITKHYGYEYNYLVFFMLFVIGYVAGMFIELVLHFALAKRRSAKH